MVLDESFRRLWFLKQWRFRKIRLCHSWLDFDSWFWEWDELEGRKWRTDVKIRNYTNIPLLVTMKRISKLQDFVKGSSSVSSLLSISANEVNLRLIQLFSSPILLCVSSTFSSTIPEYNLRNFGSVSASAWSFRQKLRNFFLSLRLKNVGKNGQFMCRIHQRDWSYSGQMETWNSAKMKRNEMKWYDTSQKWKQEIEKLDRNGAAASGS